MEIHNGIEPAGMNSTYLARRVTDVLNGHHIGRAENVRQPNEHKMLQSFGHPLAESDGSGAVFLFGSNQVVADYLKRLLPADFIPLSLPSIPSSFQGMFEAGRVSEAFGGRQAFGTNITCIQESFGIPFDAHDLSVFDPYKDGASSMIHSSAVSFHPAYVLWHLQASFDPIGVC
jgi:hypothetical protein